MTASSVVKCTCKVLSGLCLMIFASGGCTYDYFVDENNFTLYVPQIEEGTIQNFYVAFHSSDGKHTITREVSAPFDQNDKMKQGLLRFKLPVGPTYTVSCFAQYTPASVTVGNAYDESAKLKELDLSGGNYYAGSGNVYISRSTRPRSLFLAATPFPVGHPDSKIALEADIDETREFKGRVILTFEDLPSSVTRIDTYYSGLSTKHQFDGTFRNSTDSDRIRGSYTIASGTVSGNTVSFSDILHPSVGTRFGAESRGPSTPLPSTPTPLELELHLYDARGNNVGIIPFTEDDFNALPDNKKPQDENGNPVTSLVLETQKTIRFHFKGFTVIGIELLGWGDIIVGPTTDM